MRTQTARRLAGRVDVVVGGSNWWSIPRWPPRAITARMEARNAGTALRAPATLGRYVGAPVVHGAIAGAIRCRMPELPILRYEGYMEGGAFVADAEGRLLAHRDRHAGQGFALADVDVARVTPVEPVPSRYWLHRRGPLPALSWNTQRLHGCRWYRRHVSGRPPLRVSAAEREQAETHVA
jgi:hypothetical protein